MYILLHRYLFEAQISMVKHAFQGLTTPPPPPPQLMGVNATTWYLLSYIIAGWQMQCEMWNLSNSSTHDQCYESNPRYFGVQCSMHTYLALYDPIIYFGVVRGSLSIIYPVNYSSCSLYGPFSMVHRPCNLCFMVVIKASNFDAVDTITQ